MMTIHIGCSFYSAWRALLRSQVIRFTSKSQGVSFSEVICNNRNTKIFIDAAALSFLFILLYFIYKSGEAYR